MSTYTAIVLAGGSGKRMGGDIPKQYLPLCGKPLLYYPLQTFEESKVDEVVLVVAPGDEEYCRKEIVEQYPEILERAREAYRSCGVEPVSTPIRPPRWKVLRR